MRTVIALGLCLGTLVIAKPRNSGNYSFQCRQLFAVVVVGTDSLPATVQTSPELSQRLEKLLNEYPSLHKALRYPETGEQWAYPYKAEFKGPDPKFVPGVLANRLLPTKFREIINSRSGFVLRDLILNNEVGGWVRVYMGQPGSFKEFDADYDFRKINSAQVVDITPGAIKDYAVSESGEGVIGEMIVPLAFLDYGDGNYFISRLTTREFGVENLAPFLTSYLEVSKKDKPIWQPVVDDE